MNHKELAKIATNFRTYIDSIPEVDGWKRGLSQMVEELETAAALKATPGPPKDGTVLARWRENKKGSWYIGEYANGKCWRHQGLGDKCIGSSPGYELPADWYPFTDPTIHPGEPPEEIKNSGVWIEAKYEFTGGGPFVVRFRWVIREWINQDGKYLSDAEVEGFQILAWRIWPPFDVAGEEMNHG